MIQNLTFTKKKKKKKKKKISLSLSERAKKKSHWIWKSLTVFIQMGFFLSQKSGTRIIPALLLNWLPELFYGPLNPLGSCGASQFSKPHFSWAALIL